MAAFQIGIGDEISRVKSELYYIGQVEGKATRLAPLLDCRVGSLPTRYLCLPLSIRPPTKEDWRGVIYKIQSKIVGWQTKLLSRGRRLILVKAVLTNLPIYYLSVLRHYEGTSFGMEGTIRLARDV